MYRRTLVLFFEETFLGRVMVEKFLDVWVVSPKWIETKASEVRSKM